MQELNHFLESAVPSSPFPERLDAIISELRAIRCEYWRRTSRKGLQLTIQHCWSVSARDCGGKKRRRGNPRSDSHQ